MTHPTLFRLRHTAVYSILSSVILAGGLFLGSELHNPAPDATGWRIIVDVLAALLAILIIGALWGLGIAIFNGLNMRDLSIAGAKSWGLTTFIFMILLEVLNAFHVPMSIAVGVSRHFIFTVAFVIAIFIITAVATRGMVRAMGRDEVSTAAALLSGLAAAGTWLLINLIMLSQGWELGRWMGGRSVMMTVTLYGLWGAAFAGGAAMGWVLTRKGQHEGP